MYHSTHLTSRFASAIIALVVMLPAVANAQTCLGTAPLGPETGRVGAVATYNDNARSLGGSLTGGIVGGLFLTGSLGRVWIDVADDPAPLFIGTGGYAFDIDWPRDVLSFQVCPFAAYESIKPYHVDLGPVVPGVDAKSHLYRGGVSVGGAVLATRSFRVVPTGSISYVRKVATTMQATDIDRVSADYGLLDGGLGVVLKGIFTTQLTVSMPIGIDRLATTYGLLVGMNFGGRDY